MSQPIECKLALSLLIATCLLMITSSESMAQGPVMSWGAQVLVRQQQLKNLHAVVAGGRHTLALKDDGSIIAWGNNGNAECNVPTPNTNFAGLAAGASHSLGLKADGSIVTWGRGTWGLDQVPPPNANFVAVAASVSTSMGLKADGSIVAWGLDDGTVPIPNKDFVAIAMAGGEYDGIVSYSGHKLALKEDGSIVGWGQNNDGQCSVPPPNTGFIAIAAGGFWLDCGPGGACTGGHSLGLKGDGSIVAWGTNSDGQCDVPPPNTDFIAVAAGPKYSLGLKADGSIVAWGDNDGGQCDVPNPNADFVALACGGEHSVGIKADGSVVAWGGNSWSQCGVSATDLVKVAAGNLHNLGLKADGSIIAWGFELSGDVPAPNTDFTAIAAGGWHSLGLKNDGSIVAWGANNAGQSSVPPPNTGFVSITAGFEHSLGLRADGSIIAWGSNSDGQCNVPPPNTDFVAVACGYSHSLGLKGDGSVVAWGQNDYMQCNIPPPNEGFAALAGGYRHSLGLKSDGSIVLWGGGMSSSEVPSPNTDFVAIAAGGPTFSEYGPMNGHSLGLKADGSIVAWGGDIYGQCNVPTPNAGFSDLAAGAGYSLGIERVAAPVELSVFEAVSISDGVLLRWTTSFESNHAGFHVHRSAVSSSSYRRLTNSLIEPPGPYRFLDAAVKPGATYYYRLEAVDRRGGREFYGPLTATALAGAESAPFSLSQNQPNPFRSEGSATAIKFSVRDHGRVRLRIFDATGRLVRVLLDDNVSRGSHIAWWDGRSDAGKEVASGSYYYRLEEGGFAEVRTLVKIR